MKAPPLLVSFESLDRYLLALGDEETEKHGPQIGQLVSQNLPPIVSIRCLAALFGFSPSLVGAMYAKPENYYRDFQIRKGKKLRNIVAPRVALKVIQKWFAEHVCSAFTFPPYLYGFIPGRSHVDAARQHCGAKAVFSADISNFFPTTSQAKVQEILMTIGYPIRGAQIASSLFCFKGFLAQGAPSSPVLSNLCFGGVDVELDALCRANAWRFTRYVDDITISSENNLPDQVADFVREIIGRTEWTLAEDKIYLRRLPARLKVHGLLVHGDRPRLTKGYRRRIRAIRHQSQAGTLQLSDNVARGHLAYASMVER
jgi:RNA-directed DNA polymerase